MTSETLIIALFSGLGLICLIAALLENAAANLFAKGSRYRQVLKTSTISLAIIALSMTTFAIAYPFL